MSILRKRPAAPDYTPSRVASLRVLRGDSRSDTLAYDSRFDLLLPAPELSSELHPATWYHTVPEGSNNAAGEQIALSPPTDLTEALASSALLALRHQDRLAGHVLLLEPPSARLARALRAGGFTGEICTLVREDLHVDEDGVILPAETRPDSVEHYSLNASGRVRRHDWLESIRLAENLIVPGAAGEPRTPHAPEQHYDVIIASELLRWVAPGDLPLVYAWLRAFLQPHGYLAVAEPIPPLIPSGMEQQLALLSFQQVRDSRTILDGWSYMVQLFQLRSPAEVGKVGWLYSLDWKALSASSFLTANLVETYRHIFGGSDWNEWARCTRPGCGRQYSRQGWEERAPEYRCDCGASPLVAFHTRESILAHVQDDLEQHRLSCFYVYSAVAAEASACQRENAVGTSPSQMPSSVALSSTDALPPSIDSFAWGYCARPQRLFETILAPVDKTGGIFPEPHISGPAAPNADLCPRESFRQKTAAQTALRRLQLWHIRHTSRRLRLVMHLDRDAETMYDLTHVLEHVFYLSELGVTAGLRSMSMARTLFQRVLQFAEDSGMDTIVLRTSRASNAYRLLIGVGMEEFYAMDQTPEGEAADAVGVFPQSDSRVVLVGNVPALLQIFSQLSDRALVAHIARSLREESPSSLNSL